MRNFSKHWGFPERAYPCIHVAGSNGKGSVCLKIAAALQSGGYRVGLYTSPHLEDFSERIMILPEAIPQDRLAHYLEQVLAVEEACFFELATMLAFLYFRDEKVDVAVIETGLGGRWDATNIVDPLLTVITSISLEHTQWLGADLESIAAEKGGIMKARVPCVLGPTATQATIKTQAQALGVPLWPVTDFGTNFNEQNRHIAEQAVVLLRPHFPKIGPVPDLRPACRFERRGRVIFDVAHNPAAFIALAAWLQQSAPHAKKRFVVGLCRDKDLLGCLKVLVPMASHIHLVQAGGKHVQGRAAPTHLLEECLAALGFTDYSSHATVAEGMRCALLSGELLTVCGSFYIMQEARCVTGGDLGQAEEELFDLAGSGIALPIA